MLNIACLELFLHLSSADWSLRSLLSGVCKYTGGGEEIVVGYTVMFGF